MMIMALKYTKAGKKINCLKFSVYGGSGLILVRLKYSEVLCDRKEHKQD